MPWVCLNHKIVDEKKAAISIRDRAFTHGDGLFETMKAVDGKILFFDEHIDIALHVVVEPILALEAHRGDYIIGGEHYPVRVFLKKILILLRFL